MYMPKSQALSADIRSHSRCPSIVCLLNGVNIYLHPVSIILTTVPRPSTAPEPYFLPRST